MAAFCGASVYGSALPHTVGLPERGGGGGGSPFRVAMEEDFGVQKIMGSHFWEIPVSVAQKLGCSFLWERLRLLFPMQLVAGASCWFEA